MLVGYQYEGTEYIFDAANVKIAWQDNDENFALIWNAFEEKIMSDYEAYAGCNGACENFEIFLGRTSVDTYTWDASFKLVNGDYTSLYALYPSLLNYGDMLREFNRVSEGYYFYNFICWNGLKYLLEQTNYAYIYCSTSDTGTTESTAQIAVASVSSSSVLLWNLNNATTPGLTMDAAWIFDSGASGLCELAGMASRWLVVLIGVKNAQTSAQSDSGVQRSWVYTCGERRIPDHSLF